MSGLSVRNFTSYKAMNKNEGWILLFTIFFYKEYVMKNLNQENGWEMVFCT